MTDVRDRVAAMLETLGQDLHPEAMVYRVDPPEPGEPSPVVLLDRVGADLPDYCIHGYVTCLRCERLCWLGSETQGVVARKEAFPLCIVCAVEVLPEVLPEPSTHIKDHRRDDGPH